MKSLKLLGLLGIAALVASCDFGSPTGGGTGGEGLTGIIVDPQGSPVSGAVVKLFPESETVLARTSSPVAPKVTATDANGRYRFEKVSQGRYSVTAYVASNDTALAALVAPINLSSRLDIGRDTLRFAGSVVVEIRDKDSVPLAGAICGVVGTPWKTTSDAAGKCRIDGVVVGGYTVKVNIEGRDPVLSPVTILAGSQPSTIPVVSYESAEIPTEWLSSSIGGYVFRLPPPAEYIILEFESSPGFSYLSTGFNIAGIISDSTALYPAGNPEFRQEYVDVGDSVPALFTTYRDTIEDENGDVSTTYVSRLYLHGGVHLISYGSAGIARLVLRNVRKWTGVGDPPLLPPWKTSLMQPKNRATGVASAPIFTWMKNIKSLHVTGYRFQLSTDSLFTSYLRNDTIPYVSDSMTQSHSVGSLALGSRYFWRVLATGRGGSTTSETRSFTTVDGPMPLTRQLSDPLDQATNIALSPTLTWRTIVDAGDARYFRVQVATDSLFGSMTVNDSVATPVVTTSGSSWTVSGLQPTTEYFWRVLAVGGSGAMSSSAIWSFMTIANP
jgi:hypothetical protein